MQSLRSADWVWKNKRPTREAGCKGWQHCKLQQQTNGNTKKKLPLRHSSKRGKDRSRKKNVLQRALILFCGCLCVRVSVLATASNPTFQLLSSTNHRGKRVKGQRAPRINGSDRRQQWQQQRNKKIANQWPINGWFVAGWKWTFYAVLGPDRWWFIILAQICFVANASANPIDRKGHGH